MIATAKKGTTTTRPAEPLDERARARAELDAVESAQAGLPKLQADVEEAQAALREANERLGPQLVAAQVAYQNATASLAHRRSRAEYTLRSTAPALVAERGPVVEWLEEWIRHVRPHTGGIELNRDREYVADFKAGRLDKSHREGAAAAEKRIQLAEASVETMSALRDALELVRDLQLQAAPDLPAAVRDILEELPERCACGKRFDFHSVLPD